MVEFLSTLRIESWNVDIDERENTMRLKLMRLKDQCVNNCLRL